MFEKDPDGCSTSARSLTSFRYQMMVNIVRSAERERKKYTKQSKFYFQTVIKRLYSLAFIDLLAGRMTGFDIELASGVTPFKGSVYDRPYDIG